MNSVLYQFLHPWHWLTYGQNSGALAAVAAVVAFIVLFLYTVYTRRMMMIQSRTMEIQAHTMDLQVQTMEMQRRTMQMQESAVRATITPKLVAQGDIELVPTHAEHTEATDIGLQQPKILLCNAILRFRNVGAGAAMFLKGWHQPVSSNFVSGSGVLVNTSQVNEVWAQMTELMKGESTSVTFTAFKPEGLHQRWLFVVDAIDQTGSKHQLQLLRTPLENGHIDVSVSMHHESEGEGTILTTGPQ